jgi:hypothetical protein
MTFEKKLGEYAVSLAKKYADEIIGDPIGNNFVYKNHVAKLELTTSGYIGSLVYTPNLSNFFNGETLCYIQKEKITHTFHGASLKEAYSNFVQLVDKLAEGVPFEAEKPFKKIEIHCFNDAEKYVSYYGIDYTKFPYLNSRDPNKHFCVTMGDYIDTLEKEESEQSKEALFCLYTKLVGYSTALSNLRYALSRRWVQDKFLIFKCLGVYNYLSSEKLKSYGGNF